MGSKTPSISEKVKFWEEQDKINKALIPRFLADHKQIVRLSEEMIKLSADVSKDIITTQSIKKHLSDLSEQYLEKIEKLSSSTSQNMQSTQELKGQISKINSRQTDLLSKFACLSKKKSSVLPYLVSGCAFIISALSLFLVIMR